MKTCKILNDANGKDSSLFPELLVAFNDNFDQAKDAYDRIISKPFMEKFGDWKKNYNSLDEHVPTGVILPSGEPKLFQDPVTRKYYFELSDGTRTPLKDNFRQSVSISEAEDFTNLLLYMYVEDGGSKLLDQLQSSNMKKRSLDSFVERGIYRWKESTEASYFNGDISREDADIVQQNMDRFSEFTEEFADKLSYKIRGIGEKITSIQVLEKENEEGKGGGLNIIDYAAANPKDSATINTKFLLSQLVDVEMDLGYTDVEVFLNDDGYYSFVDTNTNEFLAEEVRIKDAREADAYSAKLSKTRKRFYKNNLSPSLNSPRFVPLDDVWSTLYPRLTDMVRTDNSVGVQTVYGKMRAELLLLSKAKPWAKELMDKLDDLSNSDERYKVYEFVQAFSKTKINYYVTEVNPRASKFKVLNATSTNTAESKLLSSWGMAFKEKFLPNSLTLDNNKRKELSEIAEKVRLIKEDFDLRIKITNNEDFAVNDVYTDMAMALTSEMNNLGMIDVVPEDINFYIAETGGTPNMGKSIDKLVSGFLFTVNKHILQQKSFSSPEGGLFNPFKQEKSVKIFTKSVSVRMQDLTESNVLANNNRSYHTYANPTYISNKINGWKADRESLEELGRTTYNNNSDWIKQLTAFNEKNKNKRIIESEKRLKELSYGIASSYKSINKNNGVDNTVISFDDQFNDNLNKMLSGKVSGRKSLFPTIVAADKSRRVEFEGFKMFNSRISSVNGTDVIRDTSVNKLIDYFEDEYMRMIDVSYEIDNFPKEKLLNHYHLGQVNGLKSQLFPEFSPRSSDPNLQDLMTALYDKNGRPISGRDAKGFTDAQRSILQKHVKDSLAEMVNEAKDLVSEAIIDVDLRKAYKNDITAIAGDYVMNGLISSVEYTKLFSGDPAYYKDGSDLIKRIPSTYSDGLPLILDENDSLTFNAAVINNVEVASKYVDVIKKSVKDNSVASAYEEVNTTDAQAWITPNRWKFIKQKLGQWGDNHDEVFRKMMAKEELQPNELKLAAQPLKGVYFDVLNGVPTYLKYSQAVLVPRLVSGTEMERVYNKMTEDPNNEIHEVITLDGVKVGALSPTTINKEGSTEILQEENISFNSFKLSNSGWKLQQNLPVKTMKSTDLGSQIQKTIFDGLNVEQTYVGANGEIIEGFDLVERLHEAVSNLSDIGKDEIIEEFGIDGERNKISNKDKLYGLLINEFKERGGNQNIIDALESRVSLDAIPQIRGRVDSILMTMFKRKIIKIQTQGGSFIQVSPFGLETVLKDSQQSGQGISIISNNYNKEGLLPPRREKGTSRTLPGQVMIPMSLAKSLLKKSKKHKDISNISREEWLKLFSQKESRELIGYRIPNQGMSSNDTLEIVGILPPEMGDSIIAYDGIPTKTGSDFDIDKMFIMAPNLVYNRRIGDQKLEVLSEDNKQYYEGKDSVEKALAQNNLINLYQTVLQSEHTYDNMMKTIDGSELKDDINYLHKEEKLKNLQLFGPINQLRIKRNYMSGKTGVGLTANQLVDHSANQSLDVTLIGAIGLYGKRGKFNRLDSEPGISSVISQFLNAYVDIAKDPYISRGNHNDVTANVVFMLIRTGVPITTINRFIGQPILKDYVKAKKQSESISAKPLKLTQAEKDSLRKDLHHLKDKKLTPEEYIIAKYNVSKSNSQETVSNIADISEKNLEDNIFSSYNNSKTNEVIDSVVFNAFMYYEKMASSLSNSVLAAKIDVNSGSSPLELAINLNKIDQSMADNRLYNYASKFDNTAAGGYKKNLEFVKNVISNSNILLTGNIEYQRELAHLNTRLGGGDFLSNIKTAKMLNNFYYTYLMSGTKFFERNTEDFDRIFVETPKKITELKKTSENYLIKELQSNYRIIGDKAFNFIGIDNTDKPASWENKIYDSWLELYYDDSTKELAKDLVRYAFTQSGFQPNLNQFYTHIPQVIMTDMGIGKEVLAMHKSGGLYKGDMAIDQIARHNADNPSIVPTAYKVPEGKTMAKMNAGFYIDQKGLEDLIGSKKTDTEYLSIVLDGKTYLFKRVYKNNGDYEFDRVSLLGVKSGKNKINEYKFGEDINSSILDINNFSANLQDKIKNRRSSDYLDNIVSEESPAAEKTVSLSESKFSEEMPGETSLDDDYIDESKIITMKSLEKFKTKRDNNEIKDLGCE